MNKLFSKHDRIINMKKSQSNNNNKNVINNEYVDKSGEQQLPTLSKLVLKFDNNSSNNDSTNNKNNNNNNNGRKPQQQSTTNIINSNNNAKAQIISNNILNNYTSDLIKDEEDVFEPSEDSVSSSNSGINSGIRSRENTTTDNPDELPLSSSKNKPEMDDTNFTNVVIMNTIKTSLEKSSNDVSLVKAVTMMPARFKDAFESLLKVNRIEGFSPKQNFQAIQATYSAQNRFTDNEFPPTNDSIFYTDNFKYWLISQNRVTPRRGQFVWKRAKDLVNNAQFAIDDETNQPFSPYSINERNYKRYFRTTDLDQGCLGNCWFVSGATGIIQNFSLFRRVVPFDNTFDDEYYTGFNIINFF